MKSVKRVRELLYTVFGDDMPQSPDALSIIGEALQSYPDYANWPDAGCHGLFRIVDFTVDYLDPIHLEKKPISDMVQAACDELNRRISNGARYYDENETLIVQFTPCGAVLSGTTELG